MSIPVDETKARKGGLFGETNFTLGKHPFYLFNHIFLQRGRELNQQLLKFGIDYARWRVLAVLHEWPDCTMQTLSETAGVDRTTLTHTVRLMIDDGLICKTTRATDRRSVVLSLSQEGLAKLNEVLPEIIGVNEKCFEGFSRHEVDHFINTLMRIISNMRDGSMPPGFVGTSSNAEGRLNEVESS